MFMGWLTRLLCFICMQGHANAGSRQCRVDTVSPPSPLGQECGVPRNSATPGEIRWQRPVNAHITLRAPPPTLLAAHPPLAQALVEALDRPPVQAAARAQASQPRAQERLLRRAQRCSRSRAPRQWPEEQAQQQRAPRAPPLQRVKEPEGVQLPGEVSAGRAPPAARVAVRQHALRPRG